MVPDVVDQQILQACSAILTVTLTDQNGSPAAAAGIVTVGVTKADGTVVVASGTATTSGATGVYNVALTPAQTATLDLLTATWTDAGDGSVATTRIEIVGGFLFSIAEARASDSTLADTSKYPDATVLAKRSEVEVECEFICDVAFVPRYRRVTLDGSGVRELQLPDSEVRTIRSVRVISDLSTGAYTAFTASELASLSTADSTVSRTDFGNFTEGLGNIVVEYEHGYDRPPPDLKTACLTRLRYRLNMSKSGIPDKATSYVQQGGGTFRIAQPGPFETGIPDVDAVYERYSKRSQGSGGMPPPVSRRLDFDPQFYSVFHGGPR